MLWTSPEATKAIIPTWVKSSTLSKSVSLVCQKFMTSTNGTYHKCHIISHTIYPYLVNNVGTNHDIPTPFDEESNETIANIVEVNINGTLKVSKLVIPQMKAR
jgi:NADP-dependent 3-hydroxy acid dehydrogenase YdfG